VVEATAAQQAAEASPEPPRNAAAQLGLGNHTRSLVRLVDRSEFARLVAALSSGSISASTLPKS
jgi:hypothetical protein